MRPNVYLNPSAMLVAISISRTYQLVVKPKCGLQIEQQRLVEWSVAGEDV